MLQCFTDRLNKVSNIGYHVSTYKFTKPKINHKKGFGESFYGCGFYITFDSDVIDYIEEEIKDYVDKYYIYTVKIDDNANIVDEDKLELYSELVDKYNGDEVKASEEMVKKGIDGLKYYSEEDGHSCVMYNPNKVKIVKVDLCESNNL